MTVRSGNHPPAARYGPEYVWMWVGVCGRCCCTSTTPHALRTAASLGVPKTPTPTCVGVHHNKAGLHLICCPHSTAGNAFQLGQVGAAAIQPLAAAALAHLGQVGAAGAKARHGLDGEGQAAVGLVAQGALQGAALAVCGVFGGSIEAAGHGGGGGEECAGEKGSRRSQGWQRERC